MYDLDHLDLTPSFQDVARDLHTVQTHPMHHACAAAVRGTCTDDTTPTQQRELDHTDHTYHADHTDHTDHTDHADHTERSRSSSGNR